MPAGPFLVKENNTCNVHNDLNLERCGLTLQNEIHSLVLTVRCASAGDRELDSNWPEPEKRGHDAPSGLDLQRDCGVVLGRGREPADSGAGASSRHREDGAAELLGSMGAPQGRLKAHWVQEDSTGGGQGLDDCWAGQSPEPSGGSGWDRALRGCGQRSEAADDIEDLLAAENAGPDLGGGRPLQRRVRAQPGVRSVASLRSFVCGS